MHTELLLRLSLLQCIALEMQAFRHPIALLFEWSLMVVCLGSGCAVTCKMKLSSYTGGESTSAGSALCSVRGSSFCRHACTSIALGRFSGSDVMQASQRSAMPCGHHSGTLHQTITCEN